MSKELYKKNLLRVHKQLCFMVLCYNRILKDPERFYNYAFEVLSILGVQEVKQKIINYGVVMEILNNTINIIEMELSGGV